MTPLPHPLIPTPSLTPLTIHPLSAVMRSAAVTGLCLLMLEQRTERDLMQAAADLVPTVCLLLRDQVNNQHPYLTLN